jgi:hypothetical protein
MGERETVGDSLGVKKAVSSERRRRGNYRAKEGGLCVGVQRAVSRTGDGAKVMGIGFEITVSEKSKGAKERIDDGAMERL